MALGRSDLLKTELITFVINHIIQPSNPVLNIFIDILPASLYTVDVTTCRLEPCSWLCGH